MRVITAMSLAVAVLFCGCGAASSEMTAAATSNPRYATLSAPPMRVTLPPTWTPSPTPPATETFTPTPTAAPTSTPGQKEICEGFQILYEIPDDAEFPWEGAIPLVAGIQDDTALIRFEAVHRASGESKQVELPGGQIVAGEFPIRLLPAPGIYDWKLSVLREPYGEICATSGKFRVLENRPASTPSEREKP